MRTLWGQVECHSKACEGLLLGLCTWGWTSPLCYIHGGLRASQGLLLTRLLGKDCGQDMVVWVEVSVYSHMWNRASICIPSPGHTNIRDRHTWGIFAAIRGKWREVTEMLSNLFSKCQSGICTHCYLQILGYFPLHSIFPIRSVKKGLVYIYPSICSFSNYPHSLPLFPFFPPSPPLLCLSEVANRYANTYMV